MTDLGFINRVRPYPMLEVFSVRFDNDDGKDPGNIYGTIKLRTDDYFCLFLYNRESKDYESVKPGERLTLIDPSQGMHNDEHNDEPIQIPRSGQCILAGDDFFIEVNLCFSPDHECISGRIQWRDWEVWDDPTDYDVPLSSKFSDSGAHRSLTVDYAVFSEAVLAKVVVKLVNVVLPKREEKRRLINADGKDSAHVYGLLKGYENLLSKEIQLFLVDEPRESVKVRLGERISLSRSKVAVSADSHLTVEAMLLNYDSESESGGNPIAIGSVDFTPVTYVKETKKIAGEYGEIEVTVTWVEVDFNFSVNCSE